MIFVERPPAPAVLDLNDPDSAGAKEMAAARVFYFANGLTPPPTTHYKAYGNRDVKEALTDLFRGKCAYCESQDSGSAQTDVEHYRPKGKVYGQEHPGYWWLAMDWTNLVLSCMHCNQSRRQLILSPEMTVEEIRAKIESDRLTTTGKLDRFPTEDGFWETDPDADHGIDSEKPLIIDPTRIDPEPLFEWTDRDRFTLAIAKDGDLRAQTTIEILGLNRRRLCEQRMTVWSRLAIPMAQVRKWVQLIETADSDALAEMARDAAIDQIKVIVEMCKPEQPHAALARAFLLRAKSVLAQANVV